MHRIGSYLLAPRFTFSRLQFNLVALFFILIGFVTGSYFALSELIPRILASTSPWTQTDWSGDSASGTVNSTVTTYSEISNTDPTTSVGNLMLSMNTGWYNSSWKYRRKLTLDNTTSNLNTTSETLTDFPILVVLSSSNIDYANTQNSGQDLRFTDSNGTTLLSYEIEKWDESGTSYVWVKVPSIDINSNTDSIYMYYGNSGASDGQQATGVWNSNYKGVWHMKETSGVSVSDSTGQNNGTKISEGNPTSLTEAAIGSGLTFDAVNDSISTGNSDLFNSANFTIEAWVYNPGGGVGSVFTRGTQNQNGFYWLYINGGKPYLQFISAGTNNNATEGPAITTNAWHHLAVVHNDGVGINFYYDGVKTTITNTNTFISASNQGTWIGTYAGSSNRYTGGLDELKHSAVARSNAYIAASYHSETNDFVAFDSQVSTYLSSGTLTSNIFDSEQFSAWGNLTYSSTGSTIAVKVRSSNSSTMSGAYEWSSCSAVPSGTDLSTTDCITDGERYIQYQVNLSTADQTATPTFQDISIAFSAFDSIDPTNATSVTIATIADSGAWTKIEPVINFSAGSDNDGGIGLAGYCIALDEVTITGIETSHALDPEHSAGDLLNALDDGITNTSTCPYIVGPGNITSINLSSIPGLSLNYGKRYYFSIKAVDLAGNVYSGAVGSYRDLVDFKYDDNPPSNVSYISAPSTVFGNVDDMFFSWPVNGGGVSADSESGVIGWQYSLDSGATWRGPDTESTLGITYIEDDGATSSHTLSDLVDGSDIDEGINTVYFRTVDEAGNFSSSSTYRTAPLNFGGEAPSFDIACDLTTGVTVTPSTSTSNSFALSWDAADAVAPNTVAGYYYMINTEPPASLSTLQSNSTSYIPSSTTTISAAKLTGSVKGSNRVYVVAYDNEDHYSQSNCIKGTYTLNSTLPDPVQNLSVTDASIKSEELWRASLSWSEPSYKGTGTLTYVVQRSKDNSMWNTITTTSGTSYTDTVTSSTTYHYRIGTYDTTSESQAAPTFSTSVSVLPKGTWDSAPALSSGPTVSTITTKKAKISWSTSRTADSKVQYGTKSGDYFTEEPSNSTQTTSHEINLTNLAPGTTYYYKAKWTDEDGNTGTSGEKTFTTDPAPSITDPKAKSIGLTSATIEYTSTGASKVKIYFGKTTAFGGTKEVSTSENETTYTTELTGLDDGSRYYYKINTFDTEDVEYEGNTLTFETLPMPKISNVRVQQVANTAQSTLLISWLTNTEVSSVVTYYPENDPGAARDEVNVTLQKDEHRMIIRSLLPQTNYLLVVKGRDKAGNEALSDTQRLTTATDTRPPQIIDLKVEGSNTSSSAQDQLAQLVVTWTTDEPSSSQVEFGEGTGTTYSQKTQEDSNLTTNHLVVISGLTPSKVYHLRAISKDKAANTGTSIDTVSITPKVTENALNLVLQNLQEVFGFLGDLRK